jgi:hypothetical protein
MTVEEGNTFCRNDNAMVDRRLGRPPDGAVVGAVIHVYSQRSMQRPESVDAWHIWRLGKGVDVYGLIYHAIRQYFSSYTMHVVRTESTPISHRKFHAVDSTHT